MPASGRACVRSRLALLPVAAALLAGLGCSHAGPEVRPATARADLLNYARPLDEAIGAPVDKALVALKVEKGLYRLTVEYRGKAVKQYPVVLGRSPVDQKLRQGDGCTPEGAFKIKALYPHRNWGKFIWIDYPTAASWARFNAAKKAGKLRPSATIGGEVGIHGTPDGQDALIDQQTNWTLGCVSLKAADIEEIYGVCQVGTPVLIVH